MKYYEKPICGIYRIKHKSTGFSYVGLSKNIFKRWKSHTNFAQKKESWQLIKKELHRHGVKEFTFEVLEECLEKDLKKREIFWIEHLSTRSPNGYNLTAGG